MGTYKQLHIPGKKVPVYSCPHAGERCHVHLVKLYFEKLPKDAFEREDFYVRPLERYSPSGPWFSAVLVGKHTFFKMVKNTCDKAGIVGNKTNHSLRATSATEMYNFEVPEKLIQERTGHRSLKALRVYEWSSDNQHQAVPSLLSSSSSTTYGLEVNKIKNTSNTVSCRPVSGASLNFTFQNLENCTINITQASGTTKD